MIGFDVSDAIQFYKIHGWWASDMILSTNELDDLIYAFERYSVGERDRLLPKKILPQWSGDLDGGIRQADYLSLQLDDVMKFVSKPLLPSIAAALSGATEVRLFHDQLIFKDHTPAAVGRSGVGWHTDRAYWRSCTSSKMITAWIPLQDTDEEMGPLAVWDGSHLWPDVDDLHTFERKDLVSIETQFKQRGRDVNVKLLPMKKGQVSFHHCRLVHGSYPNRSPRARLGFAIHYQDGPNRRTRIQDSDGNAPPVHLNDLLCRSDSDGFPDYADPEICPVLWQAQ